MLSCRGFQGKENQIFKKGVGGEANKEKRGKKIKKKKKEEKVENEGGRRWKSSRGKKGRGGGERIEDEDET